VVLAKDEASLKKWSCWDPECINNHNNIVPIARGRVKPTTPRTSAKNVKDKRFLCKRRP